MFLVESNTLSPTRTVGLGSVVRLPSLPVGIGPSSFAPFGILEATTFVVQIGRRSKFEVPCYGWGFHNRGPGAIRNCRRTGCTSWWRRFGYWLQTQPWVANWPSRLAGMRESIEGIVLLRRSGVLFVCPFLDDRPLTYRIGF